MRNFILLLLVLTRSSFASTVKEPLPFLWGVGNAAFQVEGSPQDSDWYRFTHKAGAIKDGTNADVATDFWNRYEEDFKLAREMGANTFRISIAWERIQPAADRWDMAALAKYERILTKMQSYGLLPVVTLQHFVLPGWLADRGGLLAKNFPEIYTQYAMTVMNRLSAAPASVKLWMTFNEPEILVFCGYFWSCWPPKVYLEPVKAVNASANIARAHLMTVTQLRRAAKSKRNLSNVQISVAKHWTPVQPKTNKDGDVKAAQFYDDMFNRQFMDAFLYGKIRFLMPGKDASVTQTIALPDQRPGMDFISINYYQRSIVSKLPVYPHYMSVTGPGTKNDLGWEMYPTGLYTLLKDVARYKLPIMISENGVADKTDQYRPDFLKAHLNALIKAKNEGVPVVGYLHWSLTDNFEWAEGLSPRFGLVEMDYKTLERKPRPSYYMYRDLIKHYSGTMRGLPWGFR
ncbi:MAG: family 1 glycosylhydrolase [Bdellovibrionales bacterium]|nr:family 1 glycosylhydrolase [Bdellovibrionales bacterium]